MQFHVNLIIFNLYRVYHTNFYKKKNVYPKLLKKKVMWEVYIFTDFRIPIIEFVVLFSDIFYFFNNIFVDVIIIIQCSSLVYSFFF